MQLKSFKCDHCKREFVLKKNLTEHRSSAHGTTEEAGKKVCTVCGSQVLHSNFSRHSRIHGNRRFCCPICHANFSDQSNCKRHMRKCKPWKHFTHNRTNDCTLLLTHWGRDKMAAISQTTFSNAFSWMKMHEFRLRFHWNLFLRFELTIFQHWFRQWLGADQATSHYVNQ